MEITYNITDTSLNREKFKPIDINRALKLFNEINWEEIQNEITHRLKKGELVEDYKSIVFRNENNILLSIYSFDKNIFISELWIQKRSLTGRFPEIINGSPKISKEEIDQIINFFFTNKIESINNLFDFSRKNELTEIGPNAKLIEEQSDQYLRDLTELRKKDIQYRFSKLNSISWGLIGFGLSMIYFVCFRIRENDILFKAMLIIVSSLMIFGGVKTLINNRKHKNN